MHLTRAGIVCVSLFLIGLGPSCSSTSSEPAPAQNNAICKDNACADLVPGIQSAAARTVGRFAPAPQETVSRVAREDWDYSYVLENPTVLASTVLVARAIASSIPEGDAPAAPAPKPANVLIHPLGNAGQVRIADTSADDAKVVDQGFQDTRPLRSAEALTSGQIATKWVATDNLDKLEDKLAKLKEGPTRQAAWIMNAAESIAATKLKQEAPNLPAPNLAETRRRLKEAVLVVAASVEKQFARVVAPSPGLPTAPEAQIDFCVGDPGCRCLLDSKCDPQKKPPTTTPPTPTTPPPNGECKVDERRCKGTTPMREVCGPEPKWQDDSVCPTMKCKDGGCPEVDHWEGSFTITTICGTAEGTPTAGGPCGDSANTQVAHTVARSALTGQSGATKRTLLFGANQEPFNIRREMLYGGNAGTYAGCEGLTASINLDTGFSVTTRGSGVNTDVSFKVSSHTVNNVSGTFSGTSHSPQYGDIPVAGTWTAQRKGGIPYNKCLKPAVGEDCRLSAAGPAPACYTQCSACLKTFVSPQCDDCVWSKN